MAVVAVEHQVLLVLTAALAAAAALAEQVKLAEPEHLVREMLEVLVNQGALMQALAVVEQVPPE